MKNKLKLFYFVGYRVNGYADNGLFIEYPDGKIEYSMGVDGNFFESTQSYSYPLIEVPGLLEYIGSL